MLVGYLWGIFDVIVFRFFFLGWVVFLKDDVSGNGLVVRVLEVKWERGLEEVF